MEEVSAISFFMLTWLSRGRPDWHPTFWKTAFVLLSCSHAPGLRTCLFFIMMKPPLHSLIPDHVRRFEQYRPSRPDVDLMRLYGLERIRRLHNNENHLGPPPAVWKVMHTFPVAEMALYPSGDAYSLRLALARKFGKSPDQFIAGNGSSECIFSVIKAFCRPGDNVITADKTFAVYEWAAQSAGYSVRLVPLKGSAFNDLAMLEAMDRGTRIIFLCNPNNPTGSYWNSQTMHRFLEAVAGRQIVVIDEAYREYVGKPDFPDGMHLIERYPNVLVFRTFSKIYGLAGLRIGFLAGSAETVEIVRRTSMIYSVNRLAQACAEAAIEDDTEHILASRAMVESAKIALAAFFEGLGLEHLSGEGSFMMVRTPMSDTLLYRMLMKKGIMVRTMTDFRFPNWVRVTMSTPEIMLEFMDAFRDVVRSRTTGGQAR
jgi:histidinol-phosphate aminotransferase